MKTDEIRSQAKTKAARMTTQKFPQIFVESIYEEKKVALNYDIDEICRQIDEKVGQKGLS
jgi:hypothetical protein